MCSLDWIVHGCLDYSSRRGHCAMSNTRCTAYNKNAHPACVHSHCRELPRGGILSQLLSDGRPQLSPPSGKETQGAAADRKRLVTAMNDVRVMSAVAAEAVQVRWRGWGRGGRCLCAYVCFARVCGWVLRMWVCWCVDVWVGECESNACVRVLAWTRVCLSVRTLACALASAC